jgi:V/A-type H+-transporting ATPase subunit C
MALLSYLKGRSNYPYAVARVQAKRGKLIPRAEYAKILKMDISEITRFLEESTYQTEVDELSSRFRGLDLLEAALAVNQERTFASVRHMLSGEAKDIIGAFLTRNLVEAIKAVLRGKNVGATREELLGEMLLEDLDTYNIFDDVLRDDVKSVEDVITAFERQGGLAARWAKVLRAVPEGATLNVYEDALDKAYFAELLVSADEFSDKGAGALLGFVRREIDSVNLKNVVRWVGAKAEGDFTPYIIPGGYALKIDDLVALSGHKDLDAFDDAIQDTRLPDDFKQGVSASASSGRQGPLALAIRSAFFASVDKLSHAHPLSVLPILVFLVRKQQEVLTIRALARGKAAGLSEERLQEMVA